MKKPNFDKAYNRYNLEAKTRSAYDVCGDVETLKKKFHTHRSSIASSSYFMFWISVAITISYVVSQIYLMLSR